MMPHPLIGYEKNVTSQTGEDGIIDRILSLVGWGGKVAVEFGADNGNYLSNTWSLEHDKNWRRYLFECSKESPGVVQAMLTAENINQIFDAAGVPQEVDVLSIDVDGNDYWLWKALNRRARIVVIEYNSSILYPFAMTIAYNPEHRWDETNYFGATPTALNKLAHFKGLRLVYINKHNCIFLDDVEAEKADLPMIPAVWSQWQRHKVDYSNRPWVTIE